MEIITNIIVAFLTGIIRIQLVPAETDEVIIVPRTHFGNDELTQCHAQCLMRTMHRHAHYP